MKIISTLATLLIATALTARADVITQTVNFGTVTDGSQFYFNQFNTSLGTLTGVELDWTVNSTISSATITNENTGTVTVSKISFTTTPDAYLPSTGTSGTLAMEGSGSKSVFPNVTLNPGDQYTTGPITFNPYTETDTYTSSSSGFSSYQGTGTVPLYLTNSFGATPTASGSGSSTTSWLTSITGSSTGSLVVKYTYTAAPVAPVPEPPSMLLGFGGLLGVAGFAFKRRRNDEAAAEEAAQA